MISFIKLNNSIAEAERFIKLAKEAQTRIINEQINEHRHSLPASMKEVSAVKRSSIDLTRSLAELRSRKERV